MLYELSTPFLNVHWFCDKLGMTGSSLQLYNGIILISSFGLCRLVWGSYQSVLIYQDMWKAAQHRPTPLKAMHKEDVVEVIAAVQKAAQKEPLPMILIILYLAGNTLLTMLNFYWFSKMIQTVSKRFRRTTHSSSSRSERK